MGQLPDEKEGGLVLGLQGGKEAWTPDRQAGGPPRLASKKSVGEPP